MMSSEQMAAFTRQLEGLGITSTNIQLMIKGALGAAGENPDDYTIITPLVIVDKRQKRAAHEPHGILISFGLGPLPESASLLNQRGLADAYGAAAAPLVITKN